jgi:DNA-directed RNA polymerase specialized sigma24 family protein
MDDPAEFGALFDRHAPAIFRFAAHRLGRQASEDVLAETFTRAFAARHRAYTVDGSLRARLYKIASNLIADELRQRERAPGARAERRPGPRDREVRVGPDEDRVRRRRRNVHANLGDIDENAAGLGGYGLDHRQVRRLRADPADARQCEAAGDPGKARQLLDLDDVGESRLIRRSAGRLE